MNNNLATALEIAFGYSPAITSFALATVISKTGRKRSPKNKSLLVSSAFYAFALLLAILPTVWLAMVILKVSL